MSNEHPERPMNDHEAQDLAESHASNPQPILRLVARARHVLRQSWVITGLALTVAVLAGAVIVLCLADVAFPFGRTLRVAALALVVVPTMYTVAAGVLRPCLRRLTEVQVARRIEKHLPNIHNRLVSCIDIWSAETPQPYCVAFYHRLVAEVRERIRGFRPRTVVDGRSLRRAALIAGVNVAVLALMVALFPRPVTTAVMRIFAPLSDIPPASKVRFTVSPGDAQALVGDPITFAATVRHGTPDDLRLRVSSVEDGQSMWYAMQEREPRTWSLTLTGLEHSVTYRVHGGGTWSRLFHLGLLERPRIEEIQTLLHYPAYMGRGEPRLNPPQASEVSGPEGGEVEVIATVGGDVSEGDIQLLRPREEPADDAEDADPFEIVETRPMAPADDGRWSGRFLLEGAGLYRIEMRNALGHANKTMQEAKFLAIPDGPPQVAVEQPRADTTVSKPVKVPVVAAVYDDFALAKVALMVQPKGQGEPWPLPIKQYDPPPRSDTALASLDLAALGLEQGHHVVCWVTATDRAGQTGRSAEFTVRIAPGEDAADLRFAQFDTSQDAFQQKLLELMIETGGLHREFEKISAAYTPLIASVDAPQDGDVSAGEPELRDAETHKKLEALRRDLGHFAAKMATTLQLAEEVGTQMDASIEQMAQLEMLPEPLAQAMLALQVAYQNRALAPITEFARLLEDAAGQTQDAEDQDAEPDLDALLELSGSVQQDLDAMQAQMRALADARADMWQDLDAAVVNLEGHMVDQQADLTQREMAELQEFLDAMRNDFDELRDEQDQLMAAFREAAPEDLIEIEARQQKLEHVARAKLETTQQLLNTDDLVRQLRRGRVPVFPHAPYDPDAAEYYVPPAEDEPDEPEPKPDAAPAQKDAETEPKDPNEEKKDEKEEEAPLYLPVLGGPRARLDPRFANRRRPTAPPQAPDAAGPTDVDDPIRARQQRLLEEIDMADRTLGIDHEALRTMIEQLGRTRAARPRQQPSRQLGQMLRSPELRQALAMSGRARQLRAAAPAAPAAPTQAAAPGTRPSGMTVYYDAPAWGGLTQRHAPAAVPPATRTVILRMQPQQREELLQGMREQAPEGYQRFVQAYFRTLARVRQPG